MMTKADAKYAILKDEERALLYAHCSRHLVGFISEGDADFFGAGVIVADRRYLGDRNGRACRHQTLAS